MMSTTTTNIAQQKSVSQSIGGVQDCNSLIEVIQAFLSQSYEFRFNVITNRIMVKIRGSDDDFHYLEDYEFNSILRSIKMNNIKCSKDTLLMVLKSDFVPKYEPFTHYLNNLPQWDGNDYVAKLASSLNVTQPKHFEKCLRKWLVGMVASLLNDDIVNQTAIIFSGEQGIGKTTWFHTILPPQFQEYIHEGYVQTKDKEVNVKISECVLILMDELENMSDKSIDSIKQLMTQKGTIMRRAYTTMSQFYVKRASFAGTVNRKHFLKDLTGNRRFLCFEAISMNCKHGVQIDQLFAQLKHLYEIGFQYWFNEDEIAELNLMNAEFRDICVEEEALTSYFEKATLDDTNSVFMTTTQILKRLIQLTGNKRLGLQSLGMVLRDLKFERKKEKGVYGYLVTPINQ